MYETDPVEHLLDERMGNGTTHCNAVWLGSRALAEILVQTHRHVLHYDILVQVVLARTGVVNFINLDDIRMAIRKLAEGPRFVRFVFRVHTLAFDGDSFTRISRRAEQHGAIRTAANPLLDNVPVFKKILLR